MRQLIESINKNFDYQITIVDNCSTDNTCKEIKKISRIFIGTKIDLILNNENKGFSFAVNQGIKHLKSKNYLLLNPDIFLSNNTLKEVFNCKKETNAGIVGVRTVNVYGKKTGSYFRFPNIMVGIFDFTNFRKLSLFDKWHNYFYCNDLVVKDNNVIVDVVTGGFMLIDSIVVKKIGYFDTDFFMYLEDVDFCLRAHKAKIKTCLCNIFVEHIGGASSNNSDRVKHDSWFHSRIHYFQKHFSFISNMIIQPIFWLDKYLIYLILKIKNEN